MKATKFIQSNKKQVFAFINKEGQYYDFITAEFTDSDVVQLCSKSFADWAKKPSQTHAFNLFDAELVKVK